MDMLDEADAMLQQEQADDEVRGRWGGLWPGGASPWAGCGLWQRYRQQHGPRWERENSAHISNPTKQEIAKFRAIVTKAQTSDREVVGKYAAIKRTMGARSLLRPTASARPRIPLPTHMDCVCSGDPGHGQACR
jgi:hypothetical protein